MSQDTLSEVLRSVRLRSAVYFYVSCAEKWVAEAPASADIAAAVMPGAERVIEYHVVTRGRGKADASGPPAPPHPHLLSEQEVRARGGRLVYHWPPRGPEGQARILVYTLPPGNPRGDVSP